jgi:GntR family transcriptional regulator, transcriptional repressor for pyruvate dehydrogenase complex
MSLTTLFPTTPNRENEPVGRRVLRGLGDYIAAHGLGPGDRLPAERELAGALGVSRGTMREALRSFEAMGALSRQPGRGSVLRPVDLGVLAGVAHPLLVRTPADREELLAARVLIEVNILPLVVRRAREEHFRLLDAANRLLEATLDDPARHVEADSAFHLGLLSAAGNKFLSQFGSCIHEFFRCQRAAFLEHPVMDARVVEEHHRIARALRAGDAELAQQWMRRHLEPYHASSERSGARPEEEADRA